MPFTSDSTNDERRNVFDVSAPVLASPEGAAGAGGSIFAAPQATAASSGRTRTYHRRRAERVWVILRSRAPRAAGLVILACAVAAPLGVVVANHGDSQPRTERQVSDPSVDRPESAARPAVSTRGSRGPRPRARERGAARRERRAGRPSRRRRRARLRPPVTAARPASPPVAAPPSVNAPGPQGPDPAPAPPPSAVPNQPERPAPAPVPEGAPPQFM